MKKRRDLRVCAAFLSPQAEDFASSVFGLLEAEDRLILTENGRYVAEWSRHDPAVYAYLQALLRVEDRSTDG
ncbi:MAG: hypothetical protein CMF26_06010 [Kiloniella sp.]|nr:hypothetical protein [Kiloniella sp.]